MCVNVDCDGCAKAILSGSYKFGFSTLLLWGGATMTYVIELYEKDSHKVLQRC